MALIIKPGSRETTRVDDCETVNELNWLCEQVGGFIESFSFRRPVEVEGETWAGMILNEEGKIYKLPPNQYATEIAHQGGLSASDWIVGTAVLFKRGEID